MKTMTTILEVTLILYLKTPLVDTTKIVEKSTFEVK